VDVVEHGLELDQISSSFGAHPSDNLLQSSIDGTIFQVVRDGVKTGDGLNRLSFTPT
jgi:hypothetical protein